MTKGAACDCPEVCDCVGLGCDHIGTRQHYLHPKGSCRFNGRVQCSIRWCDRPIASVLGTGTGYQFDVCQEHLDASLGIPADKNYERSVKEVLDGR